MDKARGVQSVPLKEANIKGPTMSLVRCNECGNAVSSSARVCPHCGKKLRMGAFGSVLVVVFFLGVVVVVIGVFSQVSEDTARRPSATAQTAPTMDAADSLIAKCGKPSLDDSTANDNPRPPIPTRMIENRAKKLRFMFIPGDGATIGSPPPYHWQLAGITDMTARDPSKARVVSHDEAAARMPCWEN